MGNAKDVTKIPRLLGARFELAVPNKDIKTCAECAEFTDPRACKKFNNFLSRLFGLIFKSDRAACIAQIRNIGIDGHAKSMAESRSQTIKRKQF